MTRRARAAGLAMHSGDAVQRVLAVASLTFREALRRRVVLAAMVMSVGFLAMYGLGLHFAQSAMAAQSAQSGLGELVRREAGAQLLYVGLFPASFLIALTAVFASAGTISSELDSGVIYGVLARPIRRGELVLGKAVGLGAMLAVFALLLNGAIVALARLLIDAPVLSTWPAGLALLVLEPMPLIALAVLGSTRLPTLANGVLCIAAYGIAFVGGLIEAVGGLFQNATMGNIGIISSLLMPLDALHRMALSLLLPQGLLFQQGGLPGMGGSALPSPAMVVYSLIYVVVVAALAARVFRHRDL
jgi:Cu-processing system permease protein